MRRLRDIKTGWIRDFPDFRDFDITKASGTLAEKVSEFREGIWSNQVQRIDLRQYCSPVENQGSLKSCTAQAGVALVEFLERKAHGRHIDASRRFLYKVTRRLGGIQGDAGATNRLTMKAMRLFGLPPESEWPYDENKFDEEPDGFHYAYANNYQAISYFRVDQPELSKRDLLREIKLQLAAGQPMMFGFTVFSSIHNLAVAPCLDVDQQSVRQVRSVIPFPEKNDMVSGGHAVVAVGFDDQIPTSRETSGAIMIRNSWGEDWADGGYGWLPYEFVTRGLTADWWSLTHNEWVSDGIFAPKRLTRPSKRVIERTELLQQSLGTELPAAPATPTDDLPRGDVKQRSNSGAKSQAEPQSVAKSGTKKKPTAKRKTKTKKKSAPSSKSKGNAKLKNDSKSKSKTKAKKKKNKGSKSK